MVILTAGIAALLLVVPALANAWTLSVKVAGGSASLGNTVTATGGAVKTITGGTNYLYPIASTTLTINKPTGYTASYRINGGAALPIAAATVVPTVVPAFTGAGSLEVTYTAPALVGFTLTQTAGGTIIAQLPNNTTNTVGGTGLVAGSIVPITIQANAGYTIASVSVAGTGLVGATRGSFDYTVAAGDVVTVTFVQTDVNRVKNLSASLLAPLAGFTTQAVKCSAIANGATGYSFSLTAKPSLSQLSLNTELSATSYFAFTPDTVGTYTVQVVVSGNGTTDTKTKDVVVTSYAAYNVSQCTSCHSSSTPASVSSYQASKHGAKVSCQECHADTPHSAAATSVACTNCHAATLSTTTHPVALTAEKCITCHGGHNPAAGIAALAPSAHPAVTLYTFEEIGMQMAGGAKVPVQVDANGKGMPYSPKQTCGTSGCHIKNGVDYTYDKISDHAFHSNQGRSEYQDSTDGKFNATKNKPWTQSTAMVGKW